MDCKYKRLAADEFKWFDQYQVLAYCTALAADKAVLIYPKHELTIGEQIDVRNSPVSIRQRTLDLDLPWKDVVAETEKLGRELLAWAN